MAIAWLTVAVTIIGIIMIPLLVLIVRLAMRWKGVEDKQVELVDDVKELVQDVKELATGMDRRVRWLEENLWKRSKPRPPRPPLLPTCYQAAAVPLPNLTSQPVGCAYSTDRTEARRPEMTSQDPRTADSAYSVLFNDDGSYKTTEQYLAEQERANRISGLRALADVLEANPHMPIPAIYLTAYATVEEARAIRHGVYGWVKKSYPTSSYFTYTRQFVSGASAWDGVQYIVEVAKQETCTRVQVGTRHVEATEAHDEPVYQWECQPINDETGDEPSDA